LGIGEAGKGKETGISKKKGKEELLEAALG
jgi:hypothetical protein